MQNLICQQAKIFNVLEVLPLIKSKLGKSLSCLFFLRACSTFLLYCPSSQPRRRCFPRLRVSLPHQSWETPLLPKRHLDCRKYYSQHIQSETPRHPTTSEPICTFRAVSAYALPDNELPLPEHSPDQVCWATADLDHLSR